MSAGLVALIFNILFLVIVLLGFLIGLGRGAKKSGVRMAWLVGFIVLVILISPMVSRAVMGIYIGALGNTLGGFVEEQIMAIPQIAELYAENAAMQEVVAGLPAMIINLVVVLLLMLVSVFISWIFYLITKAIFFRKSKATEKYYTIRNGKPVVFEGKAPPEKKHRLWGGVIGAVGGFVLCFCMFLPVTGTVRTVMQYVDVGAVAVAEVEGEESASQNAFEYAEVSKMLTDTLGAEVIGYLNALNSSVLVKMQSLGNLDLMIYDTMSTVRIGGEKVSLRNELNAVASVAEVTFTLQKVFDPNVEFQASALNFDQLEKAVKAVFDSGLVKGFGLATVESLLDDAVNGDLLATMVQDGVFGQDVADTAKIVLDELWVAIQTQGGDLADFLKHDLLAFLSAAKAAVESGAADEILGASEVTVPVLRAALEKLDSQPQDAKEDDPTYMQTMVRDLMDSRTLQAGVVGAVNVALGYLEEVVQEWLERDGAWQQGDEAIAFSRLTQANMDWNKFAQTFEVILTDGADAFVFANQALGDKFDGELVNLVKTAGAGDAISDVGAVLDAVKNSPILNNTTDGASILEQILAELGKLEIVNKYVDVDVLADVSFADEFVAVKELYDVAEPALRAGSLENAAYVDIDWATVQTNRTVERLFAGNLLKAVKTAELKAQFVDKMGDGLLRDVLNVAFENKTVLSDFAGLAVPLSETLCLMGQAGALVPIFANVTPDEEGTRYAIGVLEAGEESEPSRISAVLKNLFNVPEVAKIYPLVMNDVLPSWKIYGEGAGTFEVAENATEWGEIAGEDLAGAVDLVLSVLASLPEGAIDDILNNSDLGTALLRALMTDAFVGESGQADSLGRAVDILTNSPLLATTLDGEVVNAGRQVIFNFLETYPDYFDTAIIFSTESKTFWQDELVNIAPVLVTLYTTPANPPAEEPEEPTEPAEPAPKPETLIDVMFDGERGVCAMVETEGFKALGEETIADMTERLCRSELLGPCAVEFVKALDEQIGKVFLATYASALTGEEDVSAQSAQIADVALAVLRFDGIDLGPYGDDVLKALAGDADVQSALKGLLGALKANADADGVFSAVFATAYAFVHDGLETFDKKVGALVDAGYVSAVSLSSAEFLAQFDDIVSVIQKADSVADLGASTLEDAVKADGGQEKLVALLDELQGQKAGVFSGLYGAVVDYVGEKIGQALDVNEVIDWQEMIAEIAALA